MAPPLRRVSWDRAHRVIRSVFPPIDLFEDIADPLDWDALASAESKTNPRIWDLVGNLALVPPERRVGGPTASLVMAPFVHCSPDRPGRFSDGTFGAWYAGETEAVALVEVAHHHAAFLRATREGPGWTGQFRQLLSRVDLDLHDASSLPGVLDPDSYAQSQALAAALRRGGSNGIVYPSVRAARGDCVALFWPDLIPLPIVQGRHYRFHYDGARVDRIRDEATGAVFAL